MRRSDLAYQVVPVLLYHSVPRIPDNDRWSVSYQEFKSHLRAIVESKRSPVTVGELAAALRGEQKLPPRAVAMTFDDVYDNTYAAVEQVCECSLNASIYVTTGKIGSESLAWHRRLKQISIGLPSVELGAHSITHPRLDELSLPGILHEVSESKRQLEDFIGRGVESFAYPHGAYDARVRDAVVVSGFTSAAAVKNALSHSNDDPWAIARWTVQKTTSLSEIVEVLQGTGVHAWSGERLRTRGYRIARRARRALRGEQA